jgi:hypothetical protein
MTVGIVACRAVSQETLVRIANIAVLPDALTAIAGFHWIVSFQITSAHNIYNTTQHGNWYVSGVLTRIMHKENPQYR